MQAYKLTITDILGEVETMVIPEENWQEYDKRVAHLPEEVYAPCFSSNGWEVEDFTNPNLYKSVVGEWVTL